MKNTIVIHRDWLIPTDEMSDAEYREYLDAIFAYAFEGKRPEDRSLRMLLRLVFQHIDNYEAKYDKSIQQRKEAVRKRWERYRKEHGLDAPTADTTVCDTIRDNTGDTVTVTDTVTGTVTDTGVPVELGTENKEKTPNGVKKKVAAATAAPVAPQQEGKAKRFSRPSVDEVRAYCSERGNAVNAESFVDFYESKGWKVGNSPMKDWRAAVRTWEKRDGRGVRRTASPNSGVTLGVDEWIDEQGNRLYGSGKRVPMSAPPRPGADYYWSRESNSWIAGV